MSARSRRGESVDELHVRQYTLDDLAAVVDVFQRAVHEGSAGEYSAAQRAAWAPEPADLDTWAERLSSGHVLVCQRRHQLVGFARAEANGTVDLLYVHPDHQRRGVASVLLGRVLSWAAGHGVRQLEADVSLTARPFFERAGFQVVRSQVVVRRGVDLRNFHMERKL